VRRGGETIRGGLLLAIGATAVVALISWVAHSIRGAAVMAAILLPIGVLTVLSVGALLQRRERMPGLRHQLAVVGTIAVGQMLVAMGLLVGVMFVSGDDALFASLVAAYAGLLGLWAARAMGGRMLHDVDQVRAGLAAVGAGRRDVNIGVRGRDELAQLAGDVERMVERLAAEEHARSAAETAHRDLLAAVSHDLRTPITSLRLLADALQDDMVEGPRRREYVARIGTHVRALGGLIDDLFELSRLQAGEVRWAIENVPLAELLLETVEAMRPAAEARRLAMRAELPDGLAAARGNPEQIQRVLFNLIQNAIRHTPADGSITVRAEPTADAVEIEVADTGGGIPDAEREKVFEAFFQGAGREARSDGSAGLGLAISRAIVEAHGGRIWLAGAPGGTRVRFSLPLAAPVRAAPGPA
jgi:signal transduction histidine kinase